MTSPVHNTPALIAILCNCQAKWEMKTFDSPQILQHLDIVGGCLKMHFVWVATLLLSW